MNTKHILIGVVVLIALVRMRKPTQREYSERDYLNDPTTWGADQWARLYGADLMQHDAQSGHTCYGMTGSMGFNAR